MNMAAQTNAPAIPCAVADLNQEESLISDVELLSGIVVDGKLPSEVDTFVSGNIVLVPFITSISCTQSKDKVSQLDFHYRKWPPKRTD